MKRRTEITIEIDRVTVISQRGNVETWCGACGTQVRLVTAREAAAIADTDVCSIFRRAEAGAFHVSVTPAGALLICLTSLLHARDHFQGVAG